MLPLLPCPVDVDVEVPIVDVEIDDPTAGVDLSDGDAVAILVAQGAPGRDGVDSTVPGPPGRDGVDGAPGVTLADLDEALAAKADLGPDGKVPAGQLPASTGGGGGAGIDDTVTGPDTTWSSQQITADRAPAMWEMPGDGPGAPPIATIPLVDGLSMAWLSATGLAQSMYNVVQFNDTTGASDGSGAGAIDIVGPGEPVQAGRIHVVRNPSTGQLTWWLPAAQ